MTRLSKILGPDEKPVAIDDAPKGEPELVDVDALLAARARNAKAAAIAETKGKGGATTKAGVSFVDWYSVALGSIDRDPSKRARDPFLSHPWVYAAAMAIAIAGSQAPFAIFAETADFLMARRRQAEFRGLVNWTPGRGTKRTAKRRWLQKSIRERVSGLRGAEPFDEHPLAYLFNKPNPYQSSVQFWMRVLMLIAYRGACRWVLTSSDGGPIGPMDTPGMVWPMPPELFEAIQENGSGGLIIGWRFRVPNEMPGGGWGQQIELGLHEVVDISMPHPRSLIDSMPPSAPVAAAIEYDLIASAYSRGLLKNNAEPSGVLTSETMLDKPAEEEIRTRWKERHEGANNAGRIAILYGGVKYQSTAIAPKEMGTSEAAQATREQILAAHGSPPSVVGLPNELNYATAQAQDYGFWERRIVPILRLVEEAIDGTLLRHEPDSTFAMFDFSGIDALRAGISEKIQQALQLAGDALHVPPRIAFQTVGLEVEKYEGDEDALVSAMLSPVKDVLLGMNDAPGALPGLPGVAPSLPGQAPGEDPNAPPGAPGAAPPGGATPGAPGAPGAPGGGSKPSADGPATSETPDWLLPAAAAGLLEARSLSNGAALRKRSDVGAMILRARGPFVRSSATKRKADGEKRQRDYVKLVFVFEKKARVRYRSWVDWFRATTLKRFDAEARRVGGKSIAGVPASVTLRADTFNAQAVLPSQQEAADNLKSEFRPLHASAIEPAFEFTVTDLGGIAVFEPDDDRIVRFFDARVQRFAGMKTQATIKAVRTTIEQGMNAGEDLVALRQRIGDAMGLQASTAKTLTVARTEVGGYMGGLRNEMFQAAGVSEQEWVSAGDEATRDSHVVFGQAGPKAIGFNYLTLVDGAGGVLRYPGDMEGPAREVINCRCVMVPTG